MKEQEAIDLVVQECISSWAETVKKATAAGYTFCIIGYFEIPDSEHSGFHKVLQPLLDDIENKGAQALVFRPHMDGLYDRTGQTIVAYAQNPWNVPAAARDREVRLYTNHYLQTRDVTEDKDPQELVRGLAVPTSAVPMFRSAQPGEHIVGAVGVCWHSPRLT